MKVERGSSQILFGLLPNQTVDLEGGVWRVSRWTDPVPIPIDQQTARNALKRAVGKWYAQNNDAGLYGEIAGNSSIEVVSVNQDRGVAVEPFPRQWRCRSCNRIEFSKRGTCQCGSTRSFAQMQFVAYHDCGRLREPFIPRCPSHNEVAVRLPGTATAREMHFYCPSCGRTLSNGFPHQLCDCGAREGMKINVHRSATVFTPHYAVLVNPPDPTEAAKFRAEGGGARALQWVLGGLEGEGPYEGTQTVAGLEESLIQQGISADFAAEMALRALERGEITQENHIEPLELPIEVRTDAQDEAISLVAALQRGRVRIQDMAASSSPPLRTVYETSYKEACRLAGLANIELLTDFPVTTLCFGFTRDGGEPGDSTLVSFRERGQIRTYGLMARTEALLVQLDPLRVVQHLKNQGFDIPEVADEKDARVEILKLARIPEIGERDPDLAGTAVTTLLHTYAHRLIRSLASKAGIERDGLSEYLLPHQLSVIVYASSRSEFVLGGLQAVFETALHEVLNVAVFGERRCPLDPGCRETGGACMACIHLGETSCRWFNTYLDRSSLFGINGYLSGNSS